MTRADQVSLTLRQERMSYFELLEEANNIATAYKQDYENETTWFEYTDGSVAVFCTLDQSILTYMCK